MPRQRSPRRSSTLPLRIAVFVVLTLAVAGGAAYAVWPKDLAATDTAPVDVTLRVRIINPDSSHHSDGGGVHGFTIVGLGIDARVQPETTQVITIPAAPAGEYAFYCDTCCGGKENPSMQGVLTLKG